MEDREWMYMGRVGRNDVTPEWIRKTDDFVERAYGEAAKGVSLVPCPCSKCDNRKRKSKKSMVEHIWKNGFSSGYTRCIFHGEAHRMREEVLRQRVKYYDADAGVADMLNDYHEAQYAGGCTNDEPELTAKVFYDMFDAAQKPIAAPVQPPTSMRLMFLVLRLMRYLRLQNLLVMLCWILMFVLDTYVRT
jgi:hypothetical protein